MTETHNNGAEHEHEDERTAEELRVQLTDFNILYEQFKHLSEQVREAQENHEMERELDLLEKMVEIQSQIADIDFVGMIQTIREKQS